MNCDGVSLAGGGGGTGPRAGGGGGCVGARDPSNTGGTVYLEGGSLSSIGVLGGRGGGGGPGLVTLDVARARPGSVGASFTNLPASANGGGALYRGCGGVGGGEGDCCRTGAEGGSGRAPRRGGGGAGGAPLLETDELVLPVCWGLILLDLFDNDGPPGGGGGGALPVGSFCWEVLRNASTKSAFSTN